MHFNQLRAIKKNLSILHVPEFELGQWTHENAFYSKLCTVHTSVTSHVTWSAINSIELENNYVLLPIQSCLCVPCAVGTWRDDKRIIISFSPIRQGTQWRMTKNTTISIILYYDLYSSHEWRTLWFGSQWRSHVNKLQKSHEWIRLVGLFSIVNLKINISRLTVW